MFFATYILIMVTMEGHVMTQEFNTKENCQAVVKSFKTIKYRIPLKLGCFAK